MLFPDYMRWRTLHQEENVTSAGEHYFRKGRLYKVGDVRPGRECYLSWGGGRYFGQGTLCEVGMLPQEENIT